MRVRELGFEMKAQPSEKMKTPEQLAREEREKLQKLEVLSWSAVLNVQHIYLQWKLRLHPLPGFKKCFFSRRTG